MYKFMIITHFQILVKALTASWSLMSSFEVLAMHVSLKFGGRLFYVLRLFYIHTLTSHDTNSGRIRLYRGSNKYIFHVALR